MNPKEFSWSADQSVTVTNPTGKDFNFTVHNKDYVVGAGKTAKMPGYIAWLYVYNISCQAAQEENNFIHWNEEGFRQKYFDRFVVGAEELIQEVEEQPKVEEFGSDDDEDGNESDDSDDSEVTTSSDDIEKPTIAPMQPRRRRNGRSRQSK